MLNVEMPACLNAAHAKRFVDSMMHLASAKNTTGSTLAHGRSNSSPPPARRCLSGLRDVEHADVIDRADETLPRRRRIGGAGDLKRFRPVGANREEARTAR
jgi:hypothetical protein